MTAFKIAIGGAVVFLVLAVLSPIRCEIHIKSTPTGEEQAKQERGL